MEKAQIGVIGLAVMGANLARNFLSKGIRTVVYNRTAEKTRAFVHEFAAELLSGKETLEDFVASLEKPRKILLMVKAGDPVDEVIRELTPLLEQGDIIIDGGNSHYRDTMRRSAFLFEHQIEFVGCGISGGEEGALHGPSLMPGCSGEAWKVVKDIFQVIAAKDFQGDPCVTLVGPDGAGHYVKMVHNGIEYAFLQMIAEAYDLVKNGYNIPAGEIADIFEQWNQGKLSSYLIERTALVLRKKDELGEGFLVDHILDTAQQKGTGTWTCTDALDRGVAVPSIAEAVFARVESSQKQTRLALAPEYKKAKKRFPKNKEKFIAALEKALYGSLLTIFAQGFDLIRRASEEENWNIDLSEVARIWQGGCIIRANVLKDIRKILKKMKHEMPSLLGEKKIRLSISKTLGSWRKVVSIAIQSGIPIHSLNSSLQYVEAMTAEQLSANLIQGLRDSFGAHGYQRTDREGIFHTNWS